MVDIEAVRNRADQPFIGEPMHYPTLGGTSRANRDAAVSGWHDIARPLPAPITDSHPAPKAAPEHEIVHDSNCSILDDPDYGAPNRKQLKAVLAALDAGTATPAQVQAVLARLIRFVVNNAQ